LRNLASSHFYHASSDLLKDLPEAIKIISEQLQDPDEKKYSDQDRALLERAHYHLRRANDDPDWRCTMRQEGMGYRVCGLPRVVGTPWAAIHVPPEGEEGGVDHSLLFGERLTALRRALYEISRVDRPGWTDEEDIVEELVTAGIKDQWEKERKLHAIDLKNASARKTKGKPPSTGSGGGGSSSKVVTGQQSGSGPTSSSSSSSSSPLKAAARSSDLSLSKVVTTRPLPPDSWLRSAALLGSTSPKLDYITEQILAHPDEKFLVFVAPGRNEAYWIGEACELRGIKVRPGKMLFSFFLTDQGFFLWVSFCTIFQKVSTTSGGHGTSRRSKTPTRSRC
jgi:hypothetical protein